MRSGFVTATVPSTPISDPELQATHARRRLESKRSVLLADIQIAAARGDATSVLGLASQLKAINHQLAA